MKRDARMATIGDDRRFGLLKASVGNKEIGLDAFDSVIDHRWRSEL